MTATESAGRFVWYDLMTPDRDGSTRFYTALMGWGTRQWEGGQPYTMWTNGERTLGGVMELSEEAARAGAPPQWLAYVAVEDVDATVQEVRKQGGGVVHEPTDIPDVGRFAMVRDPQGAVLAVFATAHEPPEGPHPPRVGEFSWHELATTDPDAAFSFYSHLFGWEKGDGVDMGDMGVYQLYGRGGATLGGVFTRPPQMPGPPAWLYYLRVADIEAAVAKVKELGGKVLHGPVEVPGGDRVAQCSDPQGGMFALHATKGSTS